MARSCTDLIDSHIRKICIWANLVDSVKIHGAFFIDIFILQVCKPGSKFLTLQFMRKPNQSEPRNIPYDTTSK